MKAQAIVIAGSLEQLVPLGADLVAWMRVRGWHQRGYAQSRSLRHELQGQPTFVGLHGPAWGGPDHPLRYEDAEAYEEYSR